MDLISTFLASSLGTVTVSTPFCIPAFTSSALAFRDDNGSDKSRASTNIKLYLSIRLICEVSRIRTNKKSSYNVTPWDRLRCSTILSALGSPLCPYDFVSGSSQATSQWVTHPEIALAPNSFNFGVPTIPKPVSSQKVSC
ncbi:hypothetical protein L3X38_014392 [Prunus dulcis]|uniref:Uncharacterized protein n=1 Tax=Prunus dulcis TaxID=3755 RepID=A0AAD4WNP3_PRUDU|nr:hypothetical protein L3X38_014392 [Prunus dulcis]